MVKGRTMTNEISEVRDIPAEILIKVLSGLAVVTLALIGYMGDSVIDEQKIMNRNLSENTEAIIRILSLYQSLEGRISRNERDIKSWGDVASDNSSRLYKIEGRRK